MLSPDLEDWLTDSGANVVARLSTDATSLTPVEQLIYEVWLLDTEAKNGGLSQYFGNRGLKQWHSCLAAAASADLPTFRSFATAVGALIDGSTDPYRDINRRGSDAENLWYKYQSGVVTELHAFCNRAL